MASPPVCANCSAAIPPQYWNGAEGASCFSCREQVFASVFPAMRVVTAHAAPARLEADGEASCFYHPGNQAAVACDACGRFLCALCELDLDGRKLCPACLERGVSVEKAASLETQRTLYDSLALNLTTWPLLTIWFPMFTAPAALFLVIRHWKTPMSILPRSRLRLWIALFLAVSQIAGMLALVGLLIWVVPRLPQPK